MTAEVNWGVPETKTLFEVLMERIAVILNDMVVRDQAKVFLHDRIWPHGRLPEFCAVDPVAAMKMVDDLEAQFGLPEKPEADGLCDDEGCPHHGTPHICITTPLTDEQVAEIERAHAETADAILTAGSAFARSLIASAQGNREPLTGKFAAGAMVGPSLTIQVAQEHEPEYEMHLEIITEAIDGAAYAFHAANVRAGWWSDLQTGQPVERNVFEMLGLIHSEISEGFEGHRKGLRDDKLPHHPMIAVELADAVIRIFDLAGAMDINLGSIIAEKARFNQTRADHKPEARLAAGGKAV